MDGWAGPEELLRDAPTWAPSLAELADLELLLAGAYAPLRGFLGASDVVSLRNTGHLTDGTPVAAAGDAGDPGGYRRDDRPGRPGPADARVDRQGRRADRGDGGHRGTGSVGGSVGGPVSTDGDGRHGAFRRLRRTPAQVRSALGDGRVLGVIVDRPLHRPQLAQIVHAARTVGAQVLLLVPVAGPDRGCRRNRWYGPCWPRPSACRRRRWSPCRSSTGAPATRYATRCCGPGSRRTTAPPTCCPRATP